MRACVVSECGGVHRARGFCDAHHQAWRTGRRPDLDALAEQAREGRVCQQCGNAIPPDRLIGAIFCRPLCKRRASRDREKINPPARKRRPCSIEGCESSVFARGWCQKHYNRWRDKGTTDDIRQNQRGACTVEGCLNPHAALGLCRLHWDRQQRKTRRAARIANRAERHCLSCEQPLRPEQRDDTLFCSRKCKEAETVASGRAADAGRRHYYLSQYGMTREEALERFGSTCNICGSAGGTGRHGNLHIDHCHATGQVRGILCNACNLAIGKFKDDPALLRLAAEYIERARLPRP